jgi:hypothetical protein
VASRLSSQHTRSQCQVSVARRWQFDTHQCWVQIASQMLQKGSEDMEVTGPHTDNWICYWLWCYGWEVMDHPAYRPDRMSNNFYIFGPCKNHLPGKQSKADNHVKQAVTSWLQMLDTTFYYAGRQALMPLCNQCFKVSVLMEVSCAMFTLKLE